jgi:hypothetical protein
LEGDEEQPILVMDKPLKPEVTQPADGRYAAVHFCDCMTGRSCNVNTAAHFHSTLTPSFVVSFAQCEVGEPSQVGQAR